MFGLAVFSASLSYANPTHSEDEKTLGRIRPIAEAREQNGSGISARMGDIESSSGYRQLFIYSPEKLSTAEFKIGESENWGPLSEFSAPDLKAYGTKSFVSAAKNQKFTVRGIRPDGTRVTYLVVNDSVDGTALSVKKIKEEPKSEVDKELAQEKPAVKLPSSNQTSRVLALAESSIGRTLGSGDCSALRGSGPALGTIGSGGAGMERLMPGQVLRLSPGSGLYSDRGFFSTSVGHYVVVESVQPDGQITFLDQNWAGGSSSGRVVRRANANLRTLRGSATIYSGN